MAELRTVGAVKALVYDAVFKRAQEIAASEKLRLVVFEGENLLKGSAECIGSSPSDVYSLSVSIDGATAVGDCSCPAGKSAKSGLCKHAVALLLRRVQELQKSETSPPGSSSKEQLISVASQSDDNAANQDRRESPAEREAVQSTMVHSTGPPASTSKRALPAWMFGAVGRAADQTQPSNKPKSNKRAAEPKPPRPVHSPIKRARRSGQPLKISNASGEEEEDPGEVFDAGPVEKCPALVVREDEDEVPETSDLPSEGAAARERRRLRALKKEVVVAADDNSNEVVKRTRGRSSKAVTNEISDDKGKDEVKRTRGRSGRVVTEEVSDPPLLPAKRRRLTRKYVAEDSENEAVPMDADANIGFGLTDEDLLFLAQEQVEKEKTIGQAEDLGPNAAPEPIEEEKFAENCSQGKKSSSSIFSMNKWKEFSSEGRGTGGALSLAPADFDWETLKTYSLGVGSQSSSQIDRPSWNPADTSDGVLQSLHPADVAPEVEDVPIPMPEATASDELNAVKNDMFDIFFGSSRSQNVAKNVTAASCSPSASHDLPNYCTAEVGLEPPTISSFVPKSVNVVPTPPAINTDLGDLTLKPNVKKKSSLKDRVKMFLG